MYVRLAFAVAAHLEPEILIVDEVLAVGDAAFQKKCLGKMEDVSNGRPHRPVRQPQHARLEYLCDTGVLLSGGQVAATGPIRDVLTEYHRRVKATRQAEVDLAAHPNRRGGTTPRLRRLTLTSDGQHTAAVRMDGPLEIAVEYDCGDRPADLKIGITIEDGRGLKVVSFSPTYQAPTLLRSAPASGVVTCSVPAMPLVEGHYLVNVYYDDGAETQSVEGACELEIIAADVFGTGRVPGPQHGLVFAPAAWVLGPTGRNP